MTLLCEVALRPDELGGIGQAAIFGSLVEPLSDSFSADAADVYDRIFAHVIDVCRRDAGGRDLDVLLRRFGVGDEGDLLRRRRRLREVASRPVASGPIRRAIVLSRVTVGADVAVTSVILRKLRTRWPDADIALLAGRQTREVFGAEHNVRVVEVGYERQGTLLGRLMAWRALVAAVDREREGLSPSELVIVDPDSRFTQLGLLPVVDGDVGYAFFESRSQARPGVSTLGELTSLWADEVFGGEDRAGPMVALPPDDVAMGTRVVTQLRAAGVVRVTAVNLGVGGNDRKRVSEDFERRLVDALLAGGHTLILDKGVGDEVERVDRIVGALARAGRRVIDLTEPALETLGARPLACDVLTWQGRLAAFGALIAASDLYVGYDSGFQHIAAALGVPLVDVFANAPGPLFVDRWTPFSRAPVAVVQVASEGGDLDRAVADVLARCRR